MVEHYKIISLLNELLNHSAKIRKGTQLIYFCPACNHHKRKLEINIDSGKFHCWVCPFKGISYRTLLYKLKASRKYYDELFKLTNNKDLLSRKKQSTRNKENEGLTLPPEFKSVTEFNGSVEYRHVIAYLKYRNVTREDIIRYNIGYCEYGKYQKRIIIPSYDCNGNLNYFTSRAYHNDIFLKYLNCDGSKNIVGFESFINFKDTINLVEGAFDAISLRRNALPLFGTIIPDKVIEKLIENNVTSVNLILDNDALKKSISNIQRLKRYNISVNNIPLPEKDPSTLGFETMQEILENSKLTSFKDLVSMKLNNI